jgi:hypothetical protein
MLTIMLSLAFAATPNPTIFTNGFDPPEVCAPQLTGTVHYQINNSAPNVNLTKFENLFGKTSAQTPAVPFPGVRVSPYVDAVGKAAYIAAKFTVPPLPPTAHGKLSVGESFGGNPVTFSITTACGFAREPSDAACVVHKASAGQGISWKPEHGTHAGVACPLVAGRAYYLNIKFEPTPPAGAGYNCGSVACKMPLQNLVDGL